MNIEDLFDKNGDVAHDLKRLDMRTKRHDAIFLLRQFLGLTWDKTAGLTGARDYQGYPTDPDRKEGVVFTLAGACRRIMCTYKSGDVCSFIAEVNAEVFGIPITHLWEQRATWEELERLLVVAEYISTHGLDAALSNCSLGLDHESESKLRAKRAAINQVWRYLNTGKAVAA